MKVALIFDHFGPYHLARVRAASRVMDLTCIELHAKSRSYGWDAGKPASDVELVSLPATELRGRDERRWLEPHLARALREAKPDVVAVNGWGDFMSLESLRWCLRNRVPAVVMSESTAWDEPRWWHREFVKGRIVRMFSAGLVGGAPQRDYLAQLGVPANRIETGYDVVDNGHFARESAKWRTAGPRDDGTERPEAAVKGGGAAGGCGGSVDQCFSKPVSEGAGGGAAGSCGVSGEQLLEDRPRPYFLVSSRFIERKNLRRLIDAYADYRRRLDSSLPPWGLVLLGTGDGREELERYVKECGVEGVVFAGFQQIDALPRWYAGAGAFVHVALTEPWGLVVNEAMASRLPVIVSERCGCAQDLVQEGVNGFLFDPEKTEVLAGLMTKVAAPDFPHEAFGEASRRIIAEWAPERFASGLLGAAQAAMQTGARRVGWLDRVFLEILSRR